MIPNDIPVHENRFNDLIALRRSYVNWREDIIRVNVVVGRKIQISSQKARLSSNQTI